MLEQGKRSVAVVCMLAAMVAPGCATIFSSPDEEVTVTSQPSGATIVVDDTATYTAPASFKLARKRAHWLLVSSPGYHSQRVEIKQVLNGTVFGNLLFGGLIGGAIDAASGAAMSLSPTKVHADLRAVTAGEAIVVDAWSDPREKEAESGGASAEGSTSGGNTGS